MKDYYFDFVPGEAYSMGYQHEGFLVAEEVTAVYDGRDGNEYVFFRKEETKTLEYRANTNVASWMDQGIKDAAKPVVQAWFVGEVT